MSKKVKIIISSVFCLLIIGCGFFLASGNTSEGDKESKKFIESIKYIQGGKYIDASNNIKNADDDEINIIQTIILYKFSEQLTLGNDITTRIQNEAENITDYLTYTYLYSKNPIYQQNIDKIYTDEYTKLYDIKDKILQDIMFNDTVNFYNLYFEYIGLSDGMFKNYENRILYDKDNLMNQISSTMSKLEELSKEYENVKGKHPLDSVPDEYIILLGLNS